MITKEQKNLEVVNEEVRLALKSAQIDSSWIDMATPVISLLILGERNRCREIVLSHERFYTKNISEISDEIALGEVKNVQRSRRVDGGAGNTGEGVEVSSSKTSGPSKADRDERNIGSPKEFCGDHACGCSRQT